MLRYPLVETVCHMAEQGRDAAKQDQFGVGAMKSEESQYFTQERLPGTRVFPNIARLQDRRGIEKQEAMRQEILEQL